MKRISKTNLQTLYEKNKNKLKLEQQIFCQGQRSVCKSYNTWLKFLLYTAGDP